MYQKHRFLFRFLLALLLFGFNGMLRRHADPQQKSQGRGRYGEFPVANAVGHRYGVSSAAVQGRSRHVRHRHQLALDTAAGYCQYRLWVLVLLLRALGALPVQTVAVCGYLEPLSAVIFSALLLHERLTAPQLLGAALIIGGALFAECVHPKHKTVKKVTA